MTEPDRPGEEVYRAGDETRPADPNDRQEPVAPAQEQPRPIQVVVANLPDLVYRLITSLMEQEPEIDLRGLPPNPAQSRVDRVQDLLLAVNAGADVLILGVERIAPLPAICTHLLSAFPDLKIIALAENGEEAMLYWLGVRKRRVQQLSANNLVHNIRRVHAVDPME